MRRTLLVTWIIVLLTLVVGSVQFPDLPLFWLTSGDIAMQWVRGGLVFMLLSQVLSEPPRNAWFRAGAGVASLGIFGWSVNALLGFDIQLLDAISFIGASFAVGITALELSPTRYESPSSSTA